VTVPRSAVIEAVSRNAWTALVLSPDGEVAEMVPYDAEPTAQDVLKLAGTIARARRFRFVPRTELSEAQLGALLAGMRPTPARRAVPVPGRAIHEFEPKLHPLARIKALADVISTWIANRLV
jgi:hypothetical protein